MRQPLSSREFDVLLAMIDRADEGEGGQVVTAAERRLWRDQVPALVVDGQCDCGLCPTVSLSGASIGQPSIGRQGDTRIVLSAGLSDALVLLFIDSSSPSYLELAPFDDETVCTEFPEPATLSF